MMLTNTPIGLRLQVSPHIHQVKQHLPLGEEHAMYFLCGPALDEGGAKQLINMDVRGPTSPLRRLDLWTHFCLSLSLHMVDRGGGSQPIEFR